MAGLPSAVLDSAECESRTHDLMMEWKYGLNISANIFLPHVIARFSTDNQSVLHHDQTHQTAVVLTLWWSYVSHLESKAQSHSLCMY